MPCVPSVALGVGKHEKSLADMRSAHLRRRKQVPFRIPPVSGQVLEYPHDGSAGISSGNSDAWGVLKKEEFGSNLAKDAPHFRPHISLVSFKLSASGKAVSLARDSRANNIHDSTPREAVEGAKVIPDRRRIQATFFHASNKRAGGKCFPFHVSDAAVAVSERNSQSEFETANSGT
jgi:hypothetical protein